jgi:dihydroorotate dehydrogenase (fumarate)
MKTAALDISTSYLGMELRSPLIPSASPLSEHTDAIAEMESCGAGAVVLHSFFENSQEHGKRDPEAYCEEIARAKERVKIPIIASLSATTLEGWINTAASMAHAGADALEMNIYHLSLSPDVPSARVEDYYVDVVRAVTTAVKIPVAVKLPPFFTNLAYMAKALEEVGADGLVLFNRFYQPDVDLLSMGPGYTLRLSSGAENRLPLRWISLLYRQAYLSLAASTGIRTGPDVLKMILCGASATQVCSILLQRGVPWLRVIEQDLRQWMNIANLNSLKEARGILSHRVAEDPQEIEREEYRKALQGYSRIDVPSWRDEAPIHTQSPS